MDMKKRIKVVLIVLGVLFFLFFVLPAVIVTIFSYSEESGNAISDSNKSNASEAVAKEETVEKEKPTPASSETTVKEEKSIPATSETAVKPGKPTPEEDFDFKIDKKDTDALLNRLEKEIKDAEKMKKNLEKLITNLEKKDEKELTSEDEIEATSLYNDYKKKVFTIGELLAVYQLNSMLKNPSNSQNRRYNKLMERAEQF
jgi:hypothetical protein